jgi:hypothetical protein
VLSCMFLLYVLFTCSLAAEVVAADRATDELRQWDIWLCFSDVMQDVSMS